MLGARAAEDKQAIMDALTNEVVPQVVAAVKAGADGHGLSAEAIEQFDALFKEGRINTAQIMEGILEAEDRMSEKIDRVADLLQEKVQVKQ